ncbi:MAG: CYTH domain-containing protein [Lachnospiraceae bacterium]|nr:CYTH domain-containing protein [Lachnospiraceae bacterium]
MENREIERKWLVKEVPEDLGKYEKLEIEQAYLSVSPAVRVRRENDDYYLTYKSSKDMPGNSPISHAEYNLPLNRASYEHLKCKRDGILISKDRYLIPLDGGLTAELDIFKPPIEPLILVEVEFESEEEALSFAAPDWFGEDVSLKPEYKNASMALSAQIMG